MPSSQISTAKYNEFDLLCLLAAVDPPPQRIESFANWNFSTLDWNDFLHLAHRHGVLPLAARNLIQHAPGIPPEAERNLRAAYENNLKRSLWFTAELARIMQHFERRQLRAIPYKGPLLAQLVYGDPGLRNFSDLDFLISAAGFDRAKHALAEMGYRPSLQMTPAVERFWLRKGNERAFDGEAGKYLVELQWALFPRFYAIDLPVEKLLSRARSTVVGAQEMPSLSPEDLLLALCLHAAKHLFARLIWLVDIAETLRSQTPDYAAVLARARQHGIVRILGVSFWLVKNLLDAGLPAPAEEIITADPLVPVLGKEFAARLARNAIYDFESTEYFRLILKLREQRADRWRYAARLLSTPGDGDLAMIRLPEGLFPLYRIVRIARLLRKLT